MATENSAATGPVVVPKSSAMGVRNTPNEKRIPNVTKLAANAAAAIDHGVAESADSPEGVRSDVPGTNPQACPVAAERAGFHRFHPNEGPVPSDPFDHSGL